MLRLPTIPFDREHMPEPDELEDDGLSSDLGTLPDRSKLRTAWLGVTVAGLAALGYSTMTHAPSTWTMGGLVGLLSGYAAYGSFLKKKHTVQFADSLYYMGFLWALFALLATFVLWPAPKVTADAVLTTFGYALVSTFAGMLLRLLVLQFQDTLPERLVYAQDTIDRRIAALNQQIDEATADVTSFRQRAANELGGTLHGLLRSLDDARDKLAEQHRTMVTTMSAGVDSSLKEVLGRFAALQVPQDLLMAEVAKVNAALGQRDQTVEQAVHQLTLSLTHTADTVTRLGNSLSESVAAQRIGGAVNELSNTIRGRTEEVANMTTALEHSRTELDHQLTGMQSLRAAFAAVSARLSTLETELKDLSSDTLSADVQDGLLNVQKAIQSSLDASKAIETAMRGVLSFLKESVTKEPAIDGK